MLSDAQIERWSRQILVPEVGGRGQARLCAARVQVTGDGPTALVAELVERAGPSVTVVDAASGDADLVIAWGGVPRTPSIAAAVVVAVDGARAIVTAVTTPCPACLALPAVDAAPAPVTIRLAATVAASETVRLLLVPDAVGRTHRLDLATGTFTTEPVQCAVCGARA